MQMLHEPSRANFHRNAKKSQSCNGLASRRWAAARLWTGVYFLMRNIHALFQTKMPEKAHGYCVDDIWCRLSDSN
jgi:hypothetical protein